MNADEAYDRIMIMEEPEISDISEDEYMKEEEF